MKTRTGLALDYAPYLLLDSICSDSLSFFSASSAFAADLRFAGFFEFTIFGYKTNNKSHLKNARMEIFQCLARHGFIVRCYQIAQFFILWEFIFLFHFQIVKRSVFQKVEQKRNNLETFKRNLIFKLALKKN